MMKPYVVLSTFRIGNAQENNLRIYERGTTQYFDELPEPQRSDFIAHHIEVGNIAEMSEARASGDSPIPVIVPPFDLATFRSPADQSVWQGDGAAPED